MNRAAAHAALDALLDALAEPEQAEPEAKPRRRARALVGPARPVTDDLAVARAKRDQVRWGR